LGGAPFGGGDCGSDAGTSASGSGRGGGGTSGHVAAVRSGGTDKGQQLLRQLAISLGLVRSVKLDYFEDCVEKTATG
jgi:hypothetical protein